MSPWMTGALAAGAAVSMGLFFLVWVLSARTSNAGFVDAAWAGVFMPVIVLYALSGPGAPSRRWAIAAMVGFWGLRLATHLLFRVLRHHPEEDSRYAALRRRWSQTGSAAAVQVKFLVFFELQALLAWLLALPFIFVCANRSPFPQPLEQVGLGLWVVGLMGESLADAQLRNFRADAANRGRVCEAGLWRYSRHPNYFFEWLIWLGYAVFALASPLGWTSLISAAVMFLFLRFLTGVPASEMQSLKSKGDAYRRYQQTTNAFFPWFQKVGK